MAQDWRSTRAWRALVEECKATYGWTCHLCGQLIPMNVAATHPLAYQADHVQPYETHPELRMALHNLRGAHRQCNRARGTTPLTPELVVELTRRFALGAPPALAFFD